MGSSSEVNKSQEATSPACSSHMSGTYRRNEQEKNETRVWRAPERPAPLRTARGRHGDLHARPEGSSSPHPAGLAEGEDRGAAAGHHHVREADLCEGVAINMTESNARFCEAPLLEALVELADDDEAEKRVHAALARGDSGAVIQTCISAQLPRA